MTKDPRHLQRKPLVVATSLTIIRAYPHHGASKYVLGHHRSLFDMAVFDTLGNTSATTCMETFH